MSAAPKSADAPAPKRGKLPLIIGLVVLLAGGGGGGYFWWSRQQAVKAAEAEGKGGHGEAKGGHGEKAEHAEEAEGGEHGGALLPLSTFTVNLADTEATRFLRTNVQLVLDADEDALKELEHEKLPIARARSIVLEVLAQQKSGDLSTPEGKDALKKAIAEKTAKALHHKVSDVLFSDFVIQF
ncbi:MAG TPA: flagellar basal body-associated FliL family protein [Luteitalea sp.]|nr:flagellar basal body-associated FliL family protein [Luteitalea sp.]